MSTNDKIRVQPSEHELRIVREHNVDDAAKLLHRSRDTVRYWRRTYFPEMEVRRGRPRRVLPQSLVDALGTAPDSVIAREHAVHKNSVRNYRIQRAIPTFPRQPSRRPDATPATSAEAA